MHVFFWFKKASRNETKNTKALPEKFSKLTASEFSSLMKKMA